MFRKVLFAGLIAPAFALADAPEVVEVAATRQGDVWRFDVTVLHADAGWDHYADAWRVEDLDGGVLGERTLLHPHDTEQPFTRSLGGVEIPPGVSRVQVRAHDSVHGWGETVELTLPE